MKYEISIIFLKCEAKQTDRKVRWTLAVKASTQKRKTGLSKFSIEQCAQKVRTLLTKYLKYPFPWTFKTFESFMSLAKSVKDLEFM